MKKTDKVTGEEFECGSQEGSCWCHELPHVLPCVKGEECIGPTRLTAMIEEIQGDTKSKPGSTDHGSSLEREVPPRQERWDWRRGHRGVL